MGRAREVGTGFEKESRRIPIASIKPLRLVSDAIRKSAKYAQITASIQEIGLVKPPVVAPDKDEKGTYLLLDGHLRIDVLKEMDETEVVCLISTDDEAFTYNRRVNRLAIIQEHKMLLKSLEKGVSDERLAKALNVDVASIQRKKRLLDGICPEAVDLLKDKHIALHALWELKKLKPFRQIEAAELMIAMNKYTISYARSLVAATPPSQLVSDKAKKMRGLTPEQLTLMERESSNLEREFRIAEQMYGENHLDLVLARGYVSKLIANARVEKYLSQHQPEILSEFKKILGEDTLVLRAVG
jgi:ParB-like chromosome segregation protein Spo0J